DEIGSIGKTSCLSVCCTVELHNGASLASPRLKVFGDRCHRCPPRDSKGLPIKKPVAEQTCSYHRNLVKALDVGRTLSNGNDVHPDAIAGAKTIPHAVSSLFW